MIVLAAVLIGMIVVFGLTALTGAPYVPSHTSAIRGAFTELRPLGGEDLVIDIGSGDGKVLKIAAELGARGYGIEINPLLVLISRLATRQYRQQIEIKLANLWQAHFPAGTTVVYTFGDSRDIKKMFQKVQLESNRIGRPIDFLSYGFEVPETAHKAAGHGFFLYQVNPLQTKVA